MPRLIIALSLAWLAAPSLFAQAPPTITAVTPNTSSTSGGTPVVITGSGLSLPQNFACILPCPTTVRFDNVEVVAEEETNTRIVVRAPAHAVGTVPLTVRTGDGRSATFSNAFSYVADGEDNYEKVLLPIYVDGQVRGQNGSLWESELWFRNNGPDVLSVAPWACEQQVCPAVFPLTRGVLPGTSFSNLPALPRVPTAGPGRLIYVTRGANYSVNVRFSDASRHDVNSGTEMPAIREAEFLTATTHLLNVPVDVTSRLLLRIYDADLPESRFRVRVYPQKVDEAAAWVDTEVTAKSTEEGSFRSDPAYAQHTQFLDPAAITVLPATVRVEVTPLTPGSRFWTFVSITNNDTQLVTLVTPQ